MAGVTTNPGGSTLVTCVEDERLEFQDGMQVSRAPSSPFRSSLPPATAPVTECLCAALLCASTLGVSLCRCLCCSCWLSMPTAG